MLSGSQAEVPLHQVEGGPGGGRWESNRSRGSSGGMANRRSWLPPGRAKAEAGGGGGGGGGGAGGGGGGGEGDDLVERGSNRRSAQKHELSFPGPYTVYIQ